MREMCIRDSLMVLLLSIFYNPGDASYSITEIVELATMQDVVRQFIIALPTYVKEVSVIIFPVLLVFAVFQLFTRQYQMCIRDRQNTAHYKCGGDDAKKESLPGLSFFIH